MVAPRYFDAAAVRAALPMRAAIAAMRDAFSALAAGRVALPPRAALPASADGTLLLMAGRTDQPAALGTKLVTVFPANRNSRVPVVQAIVILFDPATGTPRTILDGTSLTAIRTGAASGLATDLLARPDAHRVAILGAGVQARTQLEAVRCVRDIESVRVWSRTLARARIFVDEIERAGLAPSDLRITDSATEAAADADIICCATAATVPFLEAGDVAPGTHINAVGSFTPAMHEFTPELAARALVVVDQLEAAEVEAGEIISAIARGLITSSRIVELGAIVNGTARGRTSADELTLFKSVGLAVQDLVAGARIELAVGNA